MINQTAKNKLPESVATLLIRSRWVLAILGVVIWLATIPVASKLDFDRRVESLFPNDDVDLVSYQKLQRVFGGQSVVLMVYRDPELATFAGVDRNRLLTDTIRRLDGVTDVLSIARLNDAMDRVRPSLTESDVPNLFRSDDEVASGFLDLFENYTHSADGSRAALVILLGDQERSATLAELKEIRDNVVSGVFFAKHSGGGETQEAALQSVCLETVLVGESVMITDALDLIQQDGKSLAILTVTLLGICLLITSGEWRLVLLATATITWTIVITQGLLVAFGWRLSIASSVLTALVTVMVVTAVLHLGIRYRRLKRKGLSEIDATVDAIRLLAWPIFWTCLTDAAGFFALSFSSLAPIRQFGLMISISVMAGMLGTCLFVGVCLTSKLKAFGLERIFQISNAQRILVPFAAIQDRLQRSIRRMSLSLVTLSVHKPRSVLLAIGVMLFVVAVGVPRLESERSFLNNFESQSQIARSYRVVEDNFGGAGVWDVMLEAPVNLTEEYFTEVRQLEGQLRKIDVNGAKLTKVLSIADAELVVRRSRFAALLPIGPRLSFMAVVLPGFFDALMSEPDGDRRYLRLMLRSREDLEAQQKEGLIAEVRKVVDEYSLAKSSESKVGMTRPIEVTGYYILLSRLIDQVVRDQWKCLIASIILVGFLIGLFLRSFRLAIISLVPNVIPLATVLAVCGLVGERLNMGAAMIAAVSIGLSIDGSVHLLYHYRRQQHFAGRGVKRSIQAAAGRTGVAVTLATSALVVGFGVLAQSEFVPTATFGLLIAITMMLGTAANLILLPALLVIVDKGDADKRDASMIKRSPTEPTDDIESHRMLDT